MPTEVKKLVASIDQYQPSAMMGAVLAVSGIDGAEIAFHGPSGCYTVATHIRTDQGPMGSYSSMSPSGITEDNLVMGTSMEKLKQLIKFTMLKPKPKLLAIVNTDATAITGDDIIGQSKKFEVETGIPTIAVDAPGMKGWDVVGYDLAYRALLAKFAKTDGIEKRPDSVNIIAPYMLSSQNWIFDFEEIRSLVNKLGLRINCVLTRNTRVEDIANFAAAQANLMLTSEELPHFNKETDKLGVRNFGAELPLPYGLINTEEWTMALAREFGKEQPAEELLKEEAKKVKSVLSFNYPYTWLANLLMQKRAAVIGRAAFAAAIARMLFYDMDCYPEIVALQAGTPQALARAKDQLQECQRDGCPMQVMENASYIEIARAIKNAEIDFVVGSRIEKALIEGMRYPHLSLGSAFYFQSFRFVPYPYAGYNGILYLLQELGLVMEDMMHEQDMWRTLKYANI